MTKNKYIAIGLVAILAIVTVLVRKVAFAKEAPSYRLVTVERGNIQSTVSATGTLNAVTTVSVGTQVSGQVSQLFADYNDHVTKGELLARIDPVLAQQAVNDAQAALAKAQAQAVQADRDAARNHQLTTDGLVAKSSDEQTQSAAEVARADVRAAEVELAKAKQNLAYTNIFAPIDGVVVDRNVQVGQTVASSLQAPQLFLIANDLSHMQILAQVGESDIASIKQGQAVEFTVQALPNQTFKGTVQQVRLQSTVQDNVVDYTVVVTVDNSAGKLLPGMTARVNFLTQSATNVLKVANAALRFRPTDAQMAELKAQRAAQNGQTGSTGTTGTPGAQHNWNGTGQRSGARPTNFGMLFYLDKSGKLAVARVHTGVTDGTVTEVSGKNLTEGMQVIAGTASASAQTATNANPFQGNSQQQQRGGLRGGF